MKERLVEDLKALLDGDSKVTTAQEELEFFSGDALGVYRAFRAREKLDARPGVVVHPTTTEEVSSVMRLASQKGVPVVPRGGGTGVMGGAVTVEGCIVIDLTGMDRIRDISREDRAARVEAGVVLQELEEALNSEGLLLGHDPWSLPIATVGGAISTDGMGYRAAKYGSMGQQVLGLEVVLPSGDVVTTRELPKPLAGPSLQQLFIGSEGTLGIITSAMVMAFPMPEERIIRAIAFPDFEAGFRAVQELYARGVMPAMVDYGEEPLTRGEDGSGGATLYLGFEGFREMVRAQDKRTTKICQTLGGTDEGQEEATHFWETRHASGERYKREVLESPRRGEARRSRSRYQMDYLHVALPASRVLEYRGRCQEILSGYPISVREWSLWARPEFFSFLIVPDDSLDASASYDMAQAVDRVLSLAQDMGGSMEYCHGVGIKFAHLMERELGSGMGLLRQIKKALDPKGILNPGTLRL